MSKLIVHDFPKRKLSIEFTGYVSTMYFNKDTNDERVYMIIPPLGLITVVDGNVIIGTPHQVRDYTRTISVFGTPERYTHWFNDIDNMSLAFATLGKLFPIDPTRIKVQLKAND